MHCQTCMDNTYEEYNSVCYAMRHWVSRILNGLPYAVGYSHKHLADTFRLTPKSSIARQSRKVVWKKPPVGWVKLNIDGSCKGNPGSSGGGSIN